ncbi:MFS transporter [Melittangium boletus]|uniref:Major facilitator transporter n=1 Tax=Melittangium boletus DSM 14713 TaxID=1294270 RepID=A0A250IP33_9BACT|nr:MFS transporter [Melittangium boletus]ATB33499.1 major facilitator transporter [Melittangium boletus DSM 14713]
MSLARLHRHVLRSLTSLSSAVPIFRPGSATPLLGAPTASTTAAAPPGHAERRTLRGSLKASVAEGIVAEVFTACAGATALTAWALALKLGPFLVGVMTALPFFAQFIQFPAAWLTSTLGHRKVALAVVLLSRQVMWPLVLLPWLPLSLEGQQRVLVTVAAVSAVLSVVGNNAWVAWMGELVPESIRGRFFGRRTALCTLGNMVASLTTGVVMDRLRPTEGLSPALPLLAAIACVAGAVCTLLMARQHDPSPPHREKAKLDFRVALLPLKDDRARRVLVYQMVWNAAVGLSAPFFTFYMLNNLKMSFLLMSVQLAAVAAVRMLSAPLWGKLIDRLGAQPVVMLCSLGIGFLPLVWLFPSPSFLWPLVADALLAGVLWGGHNLAIFALPLAVAPRKGRPFYLAAFSTAGGLSYALASSLGGGLASLLPTEFTLGGHLWANLQVLFLLSGLARMAAAFLALRIIEPGARTVGSLGELVALVRPKRDAPALERTRPGPSLAEPVPVRAEG